jgi:hypothetical protein
MKERMNIDAAEPGIYKAMNAAEKQNISASRRLPNSFL